MARLLVAKSKWEIIAFKYKEISLAMTSADLVIDKYRGQTMGGATPVFRRTSEPPNHPTIQPLPHFQSQSQSPPGKVGQRDGLWRWPPISDV